MRDNFAEILKPYSADFPHLTAAFSAAAAIAPRERLAWAKEQRKSILRDGWFINTPVGSRGDGETVEDHVQHLMQLIRRFFPAALQTQAEVYAEYHDDHEVLAHAVIDGIRRDLNPQFNRCAYRISVDDKKAIEAQARIILFEGFPELKDTVDAYPNASDPASKLFSDLDKICVMWKCADFVESGRYEYSDFHAYWEYWTPENVRKKCSPFISEIYEADLWSRVQKFQL
ncbi:MAG: hypothetical protein H6865_08305 [Rhodospirillales bacterium]|nr:hypothetical protein [Alphaproteobacteria bacterium]MCB9987616.1 hypothetical protein [Rhodospirillales bacterium]USO07669.1 MAG: hypothetical protein H6866_00045 [Rhodospirillales bacterium]